MKDPEFEWWTPASWIKWRLEVNSQYCMKYDRQEVLSKRRQAVYASYYEEESVEVCKKKVLQSKLMAKNTKLDRQKAKLDLNSQNIMLQKARYLAVRIWITVLAIQWMEISWFKIGCMERIFFLDID